MNVPQLFIQGVNILDVKCNLFLRNFITYSKSTIIKAYGNWFALFPKYHISLGMDSAKQICFTIK